MQLRKSGQGARKATSLGAYGGGRGLTEGARLPAPIASLEDWDQGKPKTGNREVGLLAEPVAM